MVVVVASGEPARGPVSAQERPSLAGRWTLNRSLSQIPRDLGFNLVTPPPAGAGGAAGSDTSSLASALFRESEVDARRRELLVDEVRNPSPRLTIVQSETAVTVTDERGRSRTFHPNGREESVLASAEIPVTTLARWDADRLEIRYRVDERRELRYTLARVANQPRLTVQVRFVERGNTDLVVLVYEPAKEGEPAAGAEGAAGLPPPVPSAAPPGGTFRASDIGKLAPPASPASALAPPVAQGPDAALKGLRKLSVVVEDLGSQEAACGLKQAAIETAVGKVLADAGVQVVRNSDEDTYLYVRIMSATASTGLCVSRYDIALYSHTMATMSYQTVPVLAQVSLFQKGGMAGGAPAAHAEAVGRGVKQYVDEIASRIRDANK